MAQAAFCIGGAATYLQRILTPTSGQEEKECEKEFLQHQHKGTFLCRWMSDPYPAEGGINTDQSDKQLTNDAFASATITAAKEMGTRMEAVQALLLDAGSAKTSRALCAAGVLPAHILVPNKYTHVVHSLRRSPGALPGFHAVYLDHCGSLVGREQQLRDVFRNHVIANGGVLAVTFSTRARGVPDWSKAKAVHSCVGCVMKAAAEHGYRLEGGGARLENPDVARQLLDYQGFEETSDIGGSAKHPAPDPEDKPPVLAAALLQWSAAETPMDKKGMRRKRRLAADVAARYLSSDGTMATANVDDSTNEATVRTMRSLAKEISKINAAQEQIVDSTKAFKYKSEHDDTNELLGSGMAVCTSDGKIMHCMHLYSGMMFLVFRVWAVDTA
ncbi:hypothetical protein CYMTET_22764 [Cymbomonas tetramitiformis]|uniref:Uncharacterized protein n=1 Tax=Cymbomonas tetramitiformis TaxID=36881 RepID=A0AAE0FZ83_9CHLO|nr:hypothetical protein CYMTET_22764 [Cymbomonas tetramitiformis]